MRKAADVDFRRSLEDVSTDRDRFEFASRETFWLTRGKLSESPLFGMDLSRVAGGGPTTMRNMTTVRRLVAKYANSD